MKIITQHINPPIPVRFWDWQAHIEGHEEDQERYGWGPTKEAAVEDLVEALLENVETSADFAEIKLAHEQAFARMEEDWHDSRARTR